MARDADNRQCPSNGVFLLSDNLNSLHNKKQSRVALFTVEIEFMLMGSCCTQLTWIKQILVVCGMISCLIFQHDCITLKTLLLCIKKNVKVKHFDVEHHLTLEFAKK